ncbi:hypothetical protein H0W91_03850 [Patescibacteria group bacterium]|nr:hypothetical protein [Patescibacteria group bacterium]
MEKITWHTVEYLHHEKTTDWYWMVAIITISIAIISIILNNVIFALLIMISSFTLTLFASKKPEIIKIDIDNIGVDVGSTHYPYVHLDSFWVETREPIHKVILKSKKVFMPFLIILIEDADPKEIKGLLRKHVREEEHTEPFLEKLLVYLGF